MSDHGPSARRRPAASSGVRRRRSAGRGRGVRARRSVTADGREYLDAAGGAIVVNVGHGRTRDRRRSWPTRPAASRTPTGAPSRPSRSRPTPPRSAAAAAWTTRRSTRSAAARRRSRPRSSSPAPTTWPAASRIAGLVIARWGSYHGNTLGALDLSGRRPLRRPYEAWLGRFRHVSAAYPYRAGEPGANALADGAELAAELERSDRGRRAGTRRRVRRRAHRRGDARRRRAARRLLAGDRRGLPAARRPAHRRRGDDRVRADRDAGSALDHWGVRPDLLVAAKGATSGYWPFGFVAASGEVHDAVTAPGAGFVHGFTYSHAPVGAAVAREVLRILAGRGPRRRERGQGRAAAGAPRASSSASHRARRRDPRPRAAGRASSSSPTARRAGRSRVPRGSPRPSCAARASGACWCTPGTGNANGIDGDTILLGPPFVVTDDELVRIAEVVAEAVDAGRPAPATTAADRVGAAGRAVARPRIAATARPAEQQHDARGRRARAAGSARRRSGVDDAHRRRGAPAARRTRPASPRRRRTPPGRPR